MTLRLQDYKNAANFIIRITESDSTELKFSIVFSILAGLPAEVVVCIVLPSVCPSANKYIERTQI